MKNTWRTVRGKLIQIVNKHELNLMSNEEQIEKDENINFLGTYNN